VGGNLTASALSNFAAGFDCLKGGSRCFAVDGENQFLHPRRRPMPIVRPSSLAVLPGAWGKDSHCIRVRAATWMSRSSSCLAAFAGPVARENVLAPTKSSRRSVAAAWRQERKL
jgi:hypothetical protein